MPGGGYETYFILGEQGVDWDTPAAALEERIYEPVSFGLKNVGDLIIPERFMRNPSPANPVSNFYNAEGPIVQHLHAEDMLVFLKHILMDAAVASVNFTPQEVYGDTALGTKAWSTPASLDTQPGATTPSSAPGRLSATVSVADSGTIVITGTNWGDQVISETLTFGAETGPIVTTQYFKTVAAAGIVTADGMDSGDLLITSDRNIFTHTIAEGDAILDGLTIEAVKGALPHVYVGVLLNSGQIDIADLITLTVNCLAKRGWNRYIYNDDNDPTKTDTPTDVSGYNRISDLVFPSWSLEVDFDASGTPIPVNSASFLFNNNLGHPDRFRGIRTRPKPTRQSNREITLTCGVDHEATALDYDAKFLSKDDVQASFYCETVEASGALRTITIDMPRCKIGTFPDPAADNYAEIISELILRPIRTVGATTSDEVVITVESVESGI